MVKGNLQELLATLDCQEGAKPKNQYFVMCRSLLALFTFTSTACAYVPQTSFVGSRGARGPVATRQSVGNVIVSENFGFDFAEDSYKNTPPAILGEENLKQWINGVNDNAFLNRQVRTITMTCLFFESHYVALFQHTHV